MYYTTLSNSGTADICVHRNKVKLYNGQVYLKNGQEFEIELFNPSYSTKLAKISINGKSISTSGIVLKPGQRVYLERFIDNPKKFLFETYEVDGTEEAAKAIFKNGDVKVEFYDEYIPFAPASSSYYYNSVGTGTGGNPLYGTLTTSNSCFLSQSSCLTSSSKRAKSVETGRVEQGAVSNQKFNTCNATFSNSVANVVNIKILPLSAKPLEISDLAQYCTNCGTKNKKNNYKFCPKCGTKY